MLDCLLLASLMLQVRQAPSAPPQPAAGTAVIRGQITDQESGVPISRASVTLRLFTASAIVITNIADNEGRFEFLNLPAGRYEISATAGEHRATHLRQSFSERPLPPGAFAPLLLRDGEARTNVNIALRRTFAISGRVVDEYGEPLSGVGVGVSAADGGPGVLFGGSQSTDDRGM